jgi:hypothetical protein
VSRIVATTDCKKALGRGIVLGVSVVLLALWVPAGAQNPPQVTPQEIEQMQEVQKNADLIGPWDGQYMVIDQATTNVFQQQGWSSEPDNYARQLMQDVGRIPPWKPQERQEAFMSALQGRYNLTPDQRSSMDSQIQREAIMVGAKHFKEILPMAMEVVKTRAAGEPFTAEQVQRWSKAIKPIMTDSIESMQRVTGNLKKTMTPEQQRQLDADVEALVKRHRDVEKMVTRWETGGWNPTDWGLQDDPIHAAAMAQYRAQDAEKDGLVAAATASKTAMDSVRPTEESDWDLYVRLFCAKYECTDVQRTTAQGILKSSKQEAASIRNARRDQIAKCDELMRKADTPEKRKAQQDELQRVLLPIAEIFNRMKSRLWEQILTTEQRKKGPPEGPAQARPPTPPAAPPPAAPAQAPAVNPAPAQPPPATPAPAPAPTSQPQPQAQPPSPPPATQPPPAAPPPAPPQAQPPSPAQPQQPTPVPVQPPPATTQKAAA